jgi:hypothetical protein
MSESEASSAPQVEEDVTDLGSAVRRVLKNALAVDGVVRGLHEGEISILNMLWTVSFGDCTKVRYE